MKNKYKLNVKVKNSLKTELKVIKILISISIIAFALSIVIEFLITSPNTPTHWDYLNNILLGVSGSSIISFLCLLFPYLRNKSNQINYITNTLKEIYVFYLEKHFYFKRLSNGENPSETYAVDLIIYEEIDVIIEKVNSVIEKYNTADFYSDEFEEIKKMLETKMLNVLTAIKRLYIFILPKDIRDCGFGLSHDKEKDYQYKLKQQDYFNLLIETIDNILSEENIKILFSKINISDFDVINEHLRNQISNVFESKDILDEKIESNAHLEKMSLLINDKIIKWDKYNAEIYSIYENELQTIMSKENFEYDKCKDLLSEINDSLGCLDFEKAGNCLKKIKSFVENE